MFLKIIASVALVIGILFAALVSDAVIARTWLASEKATAAMQDPSCMIVGQPWPDWKWANTPWLSPPCDESKNIPGKASDKTNADSGDVAKQSNANSATPPATPKDVGEIKLEIKPDAAK